MYKQGYKKFIETRLSIVDKESSTVPFVLNSVQNKYLAEGTGRDVILKARQQGFSSLILGIFTADFLLKENSYSVIVANDSDNASKLLDRVKMYIKAYEDKTGIKTPLKYNSKYELYHEVLKSRYVIGTAQNSEFGRSQTINNLHLSEFAFYPDSERLFAGAMQAVVPTGRVIIETTANGFNFFKSLWDECMAGERPLTPLFYKASDFYDGDFLDNKRRELKDKFAQEYPDTAEEAFLTSGALYFDSGALRYYIENVKQPITSNQIYI